MARTTANPDPDAPDPRVVRFLSDAYAAAGERLQELVLHPWGRTEAAIEFRQARAASLARRIDTIVAGLRRQAAAWTGSELLAAAEKGRTTADRQARDSGIRPEKQAISGDFALIDARTVQVIARSTASDLDNAARSMGDSAKQLIRTTAQNLLSEQDINTILAGGVIEGTPRQTIKRLRDEFQRVARGGLIQAGSMHFEPSYYAQMVARTQIRKATVVARHQRLGDLGLDLVRIVGKVSDNFCTAFLGQVFSLSGRSREYPAYNSLPGGGAPFHPNCSKSTAPYVQELATAAQEKAAEGVDDADKLLGMDPAKAQRAYKDLQLRAQVEDRYKASTRR